jgi:hypothetical protein
MDARLLLVHRRGWRYLWNDPPCYTLSCVTPLWSASAVWLSSWMKLMKISDMRLLQFSL